MTTDLSKLHNLVGQIRAKQAQHAKPAATRKPWVIKNVSDTEAELYIYDMIGDWGVTAQDFQNDLDSLNQVKNLTIRFKSEGGQVFDGIAMYEGIARHPAQTTGIVDSLAASAASFIFMACDKRLMAKTGRLMIHDAGVGGIYVEGNAAQVRESIEEISAFADLLDSLSDTIAGIYADKAGGTVAQWRATMSKDKWYTASEAVDAGLADGIVGEEVPEAPEQQPENTTAWWDTREFTNQMKGILG